MAAKGAKLAASGGLTEAKVIAGFKAILYDAHIEKGDFAKTEVMSRALAIRKEIGDFIDCVIVASAAAKADAFLTEDNELQRLISLESMLTKLRPTNPKFRPYSAKRFL